MYGCCYRNKVKEYRPVFATRTGGYRYGPKSYLRKADAVRAMQRHPRGKRVDTFTS